MLEVDGLSARRRPRRRRRCTTSRSTVRAGEVLGDRGRRGQRPARAGRGDHRACGRCTAGTVRVGGDAAAHRRPARGDHGRASRTCPRTGSHTGVAPSLSIASNIVLKSYRTDAARGPFLRLGRIRDRAVELIEPLRREGARAADARPASSRAATCRRSCSRASSRASRACSSPRRRPAASTSARSRPCTGYLREAAARRRRRCC